MQTRHVARSVLSESTGTPRVLPQQVAEARDSIRKTTCAVLKRIADYPMNRVAEPLPWNIIAATVQHAAAA
jgi:hypothetical protein